MKEVTTRKALKLVDQLQEVLPTRGRVMILPHDHPDPDALASAAAMHLLLQQRFGLNGQIMFTGMVARAENQELLRHFKYRWRYPSQVRVAAKKKIPAIFVDTAPWSGNVTVPSFVRPVAVIDHHPGRKKAKPVAYSDIRRGAGATATIVYQYLRACEITIPKWLSTILTYAINTETLDLSRDTGPNDLQAYSELVAQSNLKMLGQIRHAPLTREYFGHLKEAMDSAQVFGRVAFTHLGNVEQSEIVAELADLLLRMERITWAFCTAFANDRLLVSLRSCAGGAKCGQVLKRNIQKPGSAGGHDHMAAGFVTLRSGKPEVREEIRADLVEGLLRSIERRTRRRSSASAPPLAPQPLVQVSSEAEDGESDGAKKGGAAGN